MKNKIHFKVCERQVKEKKQLFTAIENECSSIGYYDLPVQNVDSILNYTDTFEQEIENIVVLGIGGSSLGAKAIYEFLKPVKLPIRNLYFFESTDPLNIMEILSKIELEKSHFLVISKSGTTVETISVFKYLYEKEANPSSYTFITDEDSDLDKFAQEIGSKVFYLPANVGGRFSVLSVVGLLPLALCGVAIKELLRGSNAVKESFFNDGYLKETLLNKAIFYAKYHTTYNINCLFAYSETLRYFTEWYVQLWGESLGKKQRHSAFHVGVTPIGLIGPKDQHSFLQLIVEGTRDKSVTFIKIEDFENELTVPNLTLPHLESLDILNKITFHDLITMQSDSVIEALKEQEDIPLDEILIKRVDEESIGELIYYYELLTSLVGQLIDVDTYNQPGVESGKIILKEKLKNYQYKGKK
ncbi:MAG: Glucose-6-phosphate isomerase (EC [uncultured Sulfurovum sp.]|uniref:Glucose-6-phosphate isomerase n=1 Tax=uncultured Sulfurovum sp. TaxID=269237 RepID=A0A6S6TGG3_9BACT|nr:MAG: Glucose-6-phosphate isomerase (EC [uncultured Sulfurovum sp.]